MQNQGDGGAYRLYLDVPRDACIEAGRLGKVRLQCGIHVYVGSARRALRQRVERHRRLVLAKHGRLHWHVDRLLVHGWTRWLGADCIPDGEECVLSDQLRRMEGVSVPLPGFGATDCTHGCPAHLYRIEPSVFESLTRSSGPSRAKGPGLEEMYSATPLSTRRNRTNLPAPGYEGP